jgi:hypothetical protein
MNDYEKLKNERNFHKIKYYLYLVIQLCSIIQYLCVFTKLFKTYI